VLAAVFTSALLVGVVSSPAMAINDAAVPAENCAPATAEAVGHPGADPLRATGQIGLDETPFPVAANNPGVSEGPQARSSTQVPCSELR
jgi:hypothetical protein